MKIAFKFTCKSQPEEELSWILCLKQLKLVSF